MWDWKRRDLHVGVLIHQPRLHIVRVYSQVLAISLFESLGASVDIGLPGEHDVLRHRLQARRTVRPDRVAAALDPGREDQIGISESVIRVQVGNEQRQQVRNCQALDAIVESGRRAADNTGSGVNQVGLAVHHNGGRGSRSFRVGRGIPVPSSTTFVEFWLKAGWAANALVPMSATRTRTRFRMPSPIPRPTSPGGRH